MGAQVIYQKSWIVLTRNHEDQKKKKHSEALFPTTWGLCQGTWLVTSRPSTTCAEQWRVQKVHSLNQNYLVYLCCVVDRCAASMRFHVKLLWYFWLIMGSRCYRLPSVTWMRHLCCPGLHWRPHRGLTMTTHIVMLILRALTDKKKKKKVFTK